MSRGNWVIFLIQLDATITIKPDIVKGKAGYIVQWTADSQQGICRSLMSDFVQQW